MEIIDRPNRTYYVQDVNDQCTYTRKEFLRFMFEDVGVLDEHISKPLNDEQLSGLNTLYQDFTSKKVKNIR